MIVLDALPVATADLMIDGPIVQHNEGGSRGRLLVVDDEVLLTNALRRYFASDFDVSVVNDARSALGLIAAGERFNAILCDCMMPGMTGADLHAALTACAPDQARRMVFLTGAPYTSFTNPFLRSIPNPWLEKPCDLADLRRALQGVIEENDR